MCLRTSCAPLHHRHLCRGKLVGTVRPRPHRSLRSSCLAFLAEYKVLTPGITVGLLAKRNLRIDANRNLSSLCDLGQVA